MAEKPKVVKETYLERVQTHFIRTKKPIPTKVEFYGKDKVVASFQETHTWGEGFTEEEALEDLREQIEILFMDHKGTLKTKLGKLPLSWRNTLDEYLEEVEIPPPL